MSDEQPGTQADGSVSPDKDTQVTVPAGTEVTVSDSAAQNPAHPVDEDPLDHVGDEQPDPWAPKEV